MTASGDCGAAHAPILSLDLLQIALKSGYMDFHFYVIKIVIRLGGYTVEIIIENPRICGSTDFYVICQLDYNPT